MIKINKIFLLNSFYLKNKIYSCLLLYEYDLININLFDLKKKNINTFFLKNSLIKIFFKKNFLDLKKKLLYFFYFDVYHLLTFLKKNNYVFKDKNCLLLNKNLFDNKVVLNILNLLDKTSIYLKFIFFYKTFLLKSLTIFKKINFNKLKKNE